MAIKLFVKKLLQKYIIKKQKGFALIFILVFIAMILGVIADIVYQTQVSVKSTIEQRNELDAQTTALTGIEFAKFLLGLNALAAKYQDNPVLPIPKDMYSLLNGQPLGSNSFDSVDKLSGVNLSNSISPEIREALKVVKGYFVLNISSENAKLNVNSLQGRNYSETQKALLRIFSTQDSEKFLETLGYTPQQLVDNMSVYIKLSVTDGYLQSATQNAYSTIAPKYQPKHAALESLEELRRIPGFHLDDIYNMFSPYFTIWPLTGDLNNLNINSAPTELIASVLTPERMDINDVDWDKFDNYRASNSFKKSGIKEWFQTNISAFKENKDSESITDKLFGTSDNIFKVESRGVVNDIERTLVVVFQQAGSQGNNSGSGDNPQNKENDPNKNDPNKNDPNKNDPNKNDPNKNDPNKNDPNKPNPQNQNTPINSNPSFQIIYSYWK
ncbi:type II secretion system minor pseudopilin [Fluviispira vulneris]|uniref:general secretion pathway protein GspK n=1 Tax=Fluviispira vulneris TaxID=2763012 RepID=UPI0016478AF7|nr:type II secretion system protein GspK [Fluviispira vulneris]